MTGQGKRRRQRRLCPYCRRADKLFRSPHCGQAACKAAYKAYRIAAAQQRRRLGQYRSDAESYNAERRKALAVQMRRIRQQQQALRQAGLNPAACSAMRADVVIEQKIKRKG